MSVKIPMCAIFVRGVIAYKPFPRLVKTRLYGSLTIKGGLIPRR